MQTEVSLFPPQIHTHMLLVSNHLSIEYYMGISCSFIGTSVKAGLDETERSCVYIKLGAKTEIFFSPTTQFYSWSDVGFPC